VLQAERLLPHLMSISIATPAISYRPPRTIEGNDGAPLEFAGSHPAHLAALRSIEAVAPYEHTAVLIEGESGTGKSYAARLLHRCSPRARASFHQVILSTLDDNIAASDLFGHLSGAYTDARQSRPGHFVTANRGTLFLDEIGKASPSVQRKLLHAIEHREIWPVGADRSVRLDVRLVAASNIPLQTLVERGDFLEDLAARLVLFRVKLPSLAERRSDIPALVRQFAALRAPSCGHPMEAPRFDDALLAALARAEWPYNLRQLDGVVQRLLMEGAMHGARELTLGHCLGELAWLRGEGGHRMPSRETVRERMRELGSATAVARSLGISRWTVYRYLEGGDEVEVTAEVERRD
jgi:two-component system, NtrC family, response regulator HydG